MEDGTVTNPGSDFGELFEEDGTSENAFSEAEVLGLQNGSVTSPIMSPCHITMHTNNFNHCNPSPMIQTTPNKQPKVVLIKQENNVLEKRSRRKREDKGYDSDVVYDAVDGTEFLNFDKPTAIEKKKKTCDADVTLRLKMNKYFKRRGYRKIMLPKVISSKAFAKMENASWCRPNAIFFGATYGAEDINEEMDRFLKFYQSIQSRNEAMSEEIKPMLMPIFVYLFRESYKNGYKTLSNKLMTDFCKKILQEDQTAENCALTIAMSMVKSSRGFEEKYLKSICETQHKFLLSESTFDQLKKFLITLKRPTLLNIFSNHFYIELKNPDLEDILNLMKKSNGVPVKSNKLSRNNTFEQLLGSVRINLPSIQVYTTNGKIASAAVSQKATMFAFGMANAGIRICEAETAKCISFNEEDLEDSSESQSSSSVYSISGHAGTVYGVAFHPKVKLLYSSGQDCAMRVWDINDTKSIGCKAVYRGHFGPIWGLSISSSGKFIATASMDTTARIWLPERIDCARVLAGHHFDVDFHPNESYVATGSVDKSARLWSVLDGEMVRMLTGANGKVGSLAFHNNGNFLAGGGDDEMIQIWDLREGEVVAELPSPRFCKDLSFCGNMLAGCFKNGSIHLWNLRTIIGGDDSSYNAETQTYSVPQPFNAQATASSLVSLYYKDFDCLYCLGSSLVPSNKCTDSDPTIADSNNVELASLNTVFTNISSVTTTTPTCYYNDNSNSGETVQSDDVFDCQSQVQTPIDSSAQSSIVQSSVPVSSEDIDESLEDTETTNNTITSSDMEFVDEQVLDSLLLDDQLQLN